MPTKKERGKAKRTRSSAAYVRRPPSLPVPAGGRDPSPPEETATPIAIEALTSAPPVPSARASAPHPLGRRWLAGLPTPCAAAVIVVAGFATFVASLGNAFNTGDDQTQIVENVPVHSMSNMALFFQGGTFYNAQGLSPLGGSYYRPLQTTAFSLLYTIFGPQPIAFHVAQAMVCTASAVLVYTIFKRLSIRSWAALVLALVFLVHPIDSQVVFAMPSMQDALFVFFGLLSVYLLMATRSAVGVVAAIVSLILALFANETALLFVALDFVYLFWWKRNRLAPFAAIALLPGVLWLVMRVEAIGWGVNPGNAPIADLDLLGRLATMPSIVLVYIQTIVWPFRQADVYHFVYPAVSVQHFVNPLVIDLAVIGMFVWTGIRVQRKRERAEAHGYWLFGLCASLGLVAHLQLIPIDATASEAWFYAPMIGVLGMCAFAGREVARAIHVDRRALRAAGFAVVVVLSVATVNRGQVWGDPAELVRQNLANSPEDYVAQMEEASTLYVSGDYRGALPYAEASVATFPTAVNYNVLGAVYVKLRNYPAAVKAYQAGLTFQQWEAIDNGLAGLTPVYGDTAANRILLITMTNAVPADQVPWYYLAVRDYQHGDPADAKKEIAQALSLDPTNATVQLVYQRMTTGVPLNLNFEP